MGATSVTRSFTTQVALTLDKIRPKVIDQISNANPFMWFYRKRGTYKTVNSGGDRYRTALRHTLQPAQPMGNFSVININPVDAVTAGFWDWRQAAAPASIGDLDEFKTRGTEAIDNIQDETVAGAIAAMEDLFSKALLQGQGAVDGTSLTTAYTALDGTVFIDPIPLLIKYDPTSDTDVGAVNQSNSWWRNQYTNSATAANSLGLFLYELDFLRIKCGRGGGGSNRFPDFHVCDEKTLACYSKALRIIARLPDYRKGDIPFANVDFYGTPVMADENVPDVDNGSTTITDGTWYMGNSEFMGITADSKGNFAAQDAIRPNNQLVETTLVVWRGTHWTDHRRKLGVLGDIDVANLATSTS